MLLLPRLTRTMRNESLNFSQLDGLLPVVIQDCGEGEVLNDSKLNLLSVFNLQSANSVAGDTGGLIQIRSEINPAVHTFVSASADLQQRDLIVNAESALREAQTRHYSVRGYYYNVSPANQEALRLYLQSLRRPQGLLGEALNGSQNPSIPELQQYATDLAQWSQQSGGESGTIRYRNVEGGVLIYTSTGPQGPRQVNNPGLLIQAPDSDNPGRARITVWDPNRNRAVLGAATTYVDIRE